MKFTIYCKSINQSINQNLFSSWSISSLAI